MRDRGEAGRECGGGGAGGRGVLLSSPSDWSFTHPATPTPPPDCFFLLSITTTLHIISPSLHDYLHFSSATEIDTYTKHSNWIISDWRPRGRMRQEERERGESYHTSATLTRPRGSECNSRLVPSLKMGNLTFRPNFCVDI